MNIDIPKFCIAELFGLEFINHDIEEDIFTFKFNGLKIFSHACTEEDAKEEAAHIVLKAIGQHSVQNRTRF